MGKKLLFGHNAYTEVLEGIYETAKAVGSTYGPNGKTVVLDNGTIHLAITKDGVSVAKAIEYSNRWKNIGALLIKDAANRTNKEAGDGTTLTTILTKELIQRGLSLVFKDLNRNDIKQAYQDAYLNVLNRIEPFIQKIDGIEDILHVATISANNDSDTGNIIKEAFEGVGDDGIVSLLQSFNGKTTVKFSAGYEFSKGFISSIFTNQSDDTYICDNPSLLLFNGRIDSINDIMPILKVASDKNLKLIIIAPEFDETVIGVLSTNIEKKNLDCCCVYAPGYTKLTVEEYMQDLAMVTSGKLITKDNLNSFNPLVDFGKAKSIKVSSMKTQIIDPISNDERIEEYSAKLREKLEHQKLDDEAMSEAEIGALKERLAKLTGGIATIYIGANSAIEMREKRDRFEDAINAVRVAISDGIIPGGGITLGRAAYEEELNFNKNLHNSDYNKAYEEYCKALQHPFFLIIESSGINKPHSLYEQLISQKGFSGFNGKTKQVCDNAIVEGIIDPVKVIKTALKYSLSIASTFLTSDTIITDDLENIKVVPNDKIIDELGDEL